MSLNITSVYFSLYFFCVTLGEELFKGAPGTRGRPGNAGFKGMKGRIFYPERKISSFFKNS